MKNPIRMDQRREPGKIRQIIDCCQPDLEIVITDDGSRTLRRRADGATWHSESGALAESKLVFVENGDAMELFATKKPTRILEIGFGTGLNFFLTASLASNCGSSLNYIAIEPDLLGWDVVCTLEYSEIRSCQPAFDEFAELIFTTGRSQKQVFECQQTKLTILESLAANEFDNGTFDIVYHDPFSPELAPGLWSAEFFRQLKEWLVPGGRLVTYCVKSDIQRRLKSLGFDVNKTRGPVGGKREVLIARCG